MQTLDDPVLDPQQPVQIADGVWWVGCHQEEASFQCHSYLIANGDQSVLIDPGSPRTFPVVRAKIERIMPIERIRFVICHHQDPDIASALPEVDALIHRSDAMVLSHWRAIVLLDGYSLHMPMICVESLGWKIDLGNDRHLEFVFTPYAHFAGSFCTYDPHSGVLFSSDLYGGFTRGFELLARDGSYFETLRPFHEHYIPSRDILVNAINNIQRKNPQIIAPQHGSVLTGEMVPYISEKLKKLDCGLFLLAQSDTDLNRLMRFNRVLRDITRALVVHRDFADIIHAMVDVMRELLPVRRIELYARTSQDGEIINLMQVYQNSGRETPEDMVALLDPVPTPRGVDWPVYLHTTLHSASDDPEPALLLPLNAYGQRVIFAVAVIVLSEDVDIDDELNLLLQRFRHPLQVAVERETLHRMLDIERQRMYEQAIRDPLTGLYTRLYMQDAVGRLMQIQDHDPTARVAMALIDIDHFRRINDSYGTLHGDTVLRRIAGVLRDTVRGADLPVRFGGEQFAVFTAGNACLDIAGFAERLRQVIAGLHFDAPLDHERITVSIGTAQRQPREPFDALCNRADQALYRAKSCGRNQVSVAEDYTGS